MTETISFNDAFKQINWDQYSIEDRSDILIRLQSSKDIGKFLQELKTYERSEFDQKFPTLSTGFYTFNIDKGKFFPDYYGLAQYFKHHLHFKCDDSYQFIYDKTHYIDVTRLKLQSLILDLTQNRCQPAHLDQFIKIIKSLCYMEKSEFSHPDGLINLGNGVLDVKKRIITTHSPTYFFRYCLTHSYDADADCSVFKTFLDFIFDGNKDLVNLIAEIIGYTLIGGYPYKHRAFMFYGEGRNGKSTLLDTITSLLGSSNVSSVSMKLIDKPFSAIRLDGKLANIVEESPNKIDAEFFKSIVAGGTISAAYKGVDEFDLSINARIFFACNEFPHFKDSTKGNRDRLVIVPFKKYIEEQERDEMIKFKILNELPGILNFALEGLARLTANKSMFTKAAAVDEALLEYINETDSVAQWIDENLSDSDDQEMFCEVGHLYAAYRKDCETDGFSPVNKNNFAKRLKNNYRPERYVILKHIGVTRRGYRAVTCSSKNYYYGAPRPLITRDV